MPYDREAQRNIDRLHLLEPKPGDYWHEMYCPIARVLDATNGWVIVQKVSGMGGMEISETDPKPHAMKLSAFKKWLSYSTMPDKTWASVIPEHFAPRGSRLSRPERA